ncbi:MAG: hypothetical protein KGI27_13250 [Thaumarchaeota archaeon]|nr:hypothetical protein [Nitrososphaerota archaeon]
MAREENTNCLSCNTELQSRYKGARRIFCTPECRQRWHDSNPGKSAKEEVKKVG